MLQTPIPPAAAGALEPGTELNGFRLQSATPVPEVRSIAYLLEHQVTGARLLHLHTGDPENLFSVSFPTPPGDDTGVAHILEHCVLAGSRSFPVREPFFEMIKMSMATFINAMTGEDSTYYPVASNVPKDLFNLAEVYFDATFHPLLTEQTFRREGHHLAPVPPANGNGHGHGGGDTNGGDTNGGGAGGGRDRTPRLNISGIVYNEMKGVFSDPNARLGRLLNHRLLPDTLYAHESGGAPEAIPDLTYEAFRQFHATYYHPTNAYFFAYGDVATAEYCSFLGARLSEFSRQPVTWPPLADPGAGHFAPLLQPRWREPRTFTDTYPIGATEPERERTFLIDAWLTGNALDPEDAALMHILSLVLAGNEAAPLRKALIQSQLGADIIHAGSGSVGREATFSVGLRGSEVDRADRFVKLVDTTLGQIAAGGISSEMVETAFRQAAFEYREVQPMFPLHTLFRVVGSWIYGEDPLRFLRIGTHLATCRARWEQEPDLFARLLHERLIANPHRLHLMMRPDRAMQARIDAGLTARVERLERELSDAAIAQAAADAAELERLNSTPNTPAQLASLPQLQVSDLPADLQHIPTTVSDVAGITLLRNDVFSNGVNYLLLDFDLTGLPPELWPYLPRYLGATAKLGVVGADYEEVARRKAAATGGIGAAASLGAHSVDATRTLRGVRFSLKALDDQMEDALALLGSIVFSVDPRDRERLNEVLVQARMGYRTGLVSAGARTAGLHAGRGLDLEGHLSEILHGLPQLALCERLTGAFDREHEALMERIEQIRAFLLVRGRLTVSHTGTEHGAECVVRALTDWSGRLRDETISDVPLGFTPYTTPPREGLAAQMHVAYCAQVMAAPHFSQPEAVSLEVGAHIVNLDWILPEIRFKGNAYGAWFRYDALGASVSLGSFRDPHITRTLDVFSRTADYVRAAAWSETDIGRAIIAVAKRGFTPLRPRPATGLALQRHLAGITPEMRNARHERLKAVTAAEVKRALEQTLAAGFPHSPVCVVSSREKLEQANTELGAGKLAIEDILATEPGGGAASRS